MKRWILIIALATSLGWLLVARQGGQRTSTRDERPLVEHHALKVPDVVDYAKMSALTYRVRTLSDVVPGGLSAAMVPVLVVWEKSDLSPGGSIIIRNLNQGGIPVSGVTVLRTAVIHPDLVLRAEYVMVPLGGPDAISHGQLRFVFGDGGAALLGADSLAVGEPEQLTDLVLSWEAWRAPGVDYSVLKGLDPRVYQLTMRAYSGVQRFLEDALQGRNWEVYTLRLPGGQSGAVELLKVCLAMGDGAARDVLSELLQRAEEEWVTTGPDKDRQGGDAVAQWREIAASLGRAHTGGDERLNLVGHTGYQSALRSCATMAVYEVNVALARLAEQGYPLDGMHPVKEASITEQPRWMTELAHTNIAGLFLHGPRAIAFARGHPSAIPGSIPGQLDGAGLLVREGGKPIRREFRISSETPWGPADQLLIR